MDGKRHLYIICINVENVIKPGRKHGALKTSRDLIIDMSVFGKSVNAIDVPFSTSSFP